MREIFSENGKLSTLRLMSFISLLVGCFIGIAGLYLGKDLLSLSALCGVFVTAAFSGKLIQKHIEDKDSNA